MRQKKERGQSKAKKLRSKERKELRAEAVKAVLDDGEKQTVVAERFGVTRQAVSQWVRQERVSNKSHGLRHLTELQRRKVRRKVVAMVGAGISQAATARKFGVSELSVGKWVKLFREGGDEALEVLQLEEGEEERPAKSVRRKETEQFYIRFDVEEGPTKVGRAEGRVLAENFVGKTVACHRQDHEIVGACFDEEHGIVLSYVYVPIERDPLK